MKADDQKRLRLDPTPTPRDRTIVQYHERAQALLKEDREKLEVKRLFEGSLQELKEQLQESQRIF